MPFSRVSFNLCCSPQSTLEVDDLLSCVTIPLCHLWPIVTAWCNTRDYCRKREWSSSVRGGIHRRASGLGSVHSTMKYFPPCPGSEPGKQTSVTIESACRLRSPVHAAPLSSLIGPF